MDENILNCLAIKTSDEILKELEPLGDFWEKHIINCSNKTIEIGTGRSKSMLYDSLLNKYFDKKSFENKTILDIGCNSGGNMIELSKYNPKSLYGVDYSEFYLKQAKYMLDLNKIENYSLEKYSFNDNTNCEQIEKDLGKFDIIFCLGVIYHCRKKTVENIFSYLYKCGKKVIMSSHTFNSPLRANVDWDISVSSIRNMALEAGFSDINNIEINDETNYAKNGKTNNFYFECIH